MRVPGLSGASGKMDQMDSSVKERSGWQTPIGLLRLAGYLEGTTLLLLLGVAVPLKRLAGLPEATSVMGPIHGFTFLMYLVLAVNAVSGGGWSYKDGLRVVIAAILPFGPFINDRFLIRKQREMKP